MVAIFLDFNWLEFQIPDPIWNPDCLQTKNSEEYGFQISTVFAKKVTVANP